MEKFQKLGLSQPILELLEKAGINEPSEIQEKSIMPVMEGADVIGSSATGSGKTLAFGAGIIERTEKGEGLQVLILTPTRELAEQVGAVLRKFSSYKRLQVSMVYGGVSIEPQIRELGSADIVVGTPGRILDHIERGTINFHNVKTVVLDEADRMLDMGFIQDVEKIIRRCPRERQTLLFSATISEEIDEISRRHMKNPVRVSAESYVDPENLKQVYYDVSPGMKFSLLVHLLRDENSGLVMVFCNTRHSADSLADNLKHAGIKAVAIHGGLEQNKRNRILKSFHEKEIHVLVCTDVAARGLDIKGVSHVYNFDIPKTDKDYIHRIGRTARAGEKGRVVNILSNRDYDNFREVIKNESLNITPEEVPKIEILPFERSRPERGSGRGFGSRGRDFGGRSPRSGRYSGRGREDRGGRAESRGYGRGGRTERSERHETRGSHSRDYNSRRPARRY